MSSSDDRDFARYRDTGDAEALAAVFDRVAPKLLLLASHWTHDVATAEDLVAVTFVQALRDAAKWDPRQPVVRWLAAILAHRGLDLKKRAALRAHEPLMDDALPGREPTPLAAAMDQEVLDRVTTAVDGLQEPYREVLVLRLVHGLQPTAIAHTLGRPPATVRKQLERGLQRLRGALPASIAGVLAGLLSEGRGLAAMREVVLSAQRATLPPATTAAIGGMLMMKTVLITACAAALLLTAFLLRSAGHAPSPADSEVVNGRNAAPRVADIEATPATTPPNRSPVAAEPVTDDACTAAIEVLVRDGEGRPVSGIGTELLPRNGRDEDLETRQGTTDSGGIARFEELPSGSYHLTLAIGECDRTADAVLAAGQRQRIELCLPVRRLHGRVVDPQGRPVPGARVLRCMRSSPPPNLWVASRQPAAVADASGGFTVAILDVRQVVALQARDDDHAESRVRILVSDSIEEPLVLQLEAEPARLPGTVTLDGKPVRDAALALERPCRESRTDASLGVAAADHDARSNANGHFELSGIAPGDATLRIRARGGAPQEIPLTLVPGDNELAIDLRPTACLHGRVLDQDGVPLAGVHVWCGHARTTTTDAGEFLFDCLAPGSTEVGAGHLDGYCARQQHVGLRTGERTDCEIRLEHLPVLSGRILDRAGRGVAGLVITAVRTDLRRGSYRAMADERGRLDVEFLRATTSGADGSFELPVMPGVDYLLDLHEPEQWLSIYGERFGRFRAPRGDIVLELQPGELATAFVAGRLVDGEGRPVTSAGFQVDDGNRIGTVGSNTPGTAHPDADGRFRIGPLPAREYTLHVGPGKDSPLPRFATPPFRLQPGRTLDLGDVTSGASATLAVSLQREGGDTFPGALLQLRAEGTREQILPFDDHGDLERTVSPGAYEMTVYGDEVPTYRRTIELSAGERKHVELTLPRGIRFPIRLPLPPDESRGTVVLRGPDGDTVFDAEIGTLFDPAGCTMWPTLARGPHTAELTCESGRRYITSFAVVEPSTGADGKPTPRELDWQPAR